MNITMYVTIKLYRKKFTLRTRRPFIHAAFFWQSFIPGPDYYESWTKAAWMKVPPEHTQCTSPHFNGQLSGCKPHTSFTTQYIIGQISSNIH